MKDLSIVIPTYNESETIANTLFQIDEVMKSTDINYEILVVDDNSKDGTQFTVIELTNRYPVRLINRYKNHGLSQSVIEGIKKSNSDIVVVTDADLSHDIKLIPQMYQSINSNNDIVIGSRYTKGGGIVDWPTKRRVISWGATFAARVLFPNITDPVSGFFGIRKNIIDNADLKPRGYKILFEILGKTNWNRVVELPYTFTNRKTGKSKLRTETILDFIRQWINIAGYKKGRAYSEINKIKNFAIVGASGIAVNMIILAALKESGVPLIGASFLAIETSILTNFLLNDYWTFGKTQNTKSFINRLFSFNSIAFGGMIINMAVLALLSFTGVYYLIGNFIGILCGFLWNFLMNRKITWNN